MESSVEITAGNIVYLLDSSGNRVSDNDATPILYQVTAVYREFRKIGLITYYREYAGTHDTEGEIKAEIISKIMSFL